MYQNLLSDSSLYHFLLQIDEDIAVEVKKGSCPCGGRLHRANYPRKARGVPDEFNEAYGSRHSFCCDREGCRRRETPASVRFLGRKVYVGAVVVLVSALQHGVTPMRMAKLKQLIKVSSNTVARWRRWWLDAFVRTAFWRSRRGRLRNPIQESKLPLSLLEAFEGEGMQQKLVSMLRFLGPLTTTRQTF